MVLIASCILLIIHLLITVWFTIEIRSWKPADANELPSISIIIAARNECHHLKKLIPSLLGQAYDDLEIIVALDRCNDGSADYLKSIEDQRLRYLILDQVPSDWDPKKYALSQCISKANGEWLLLTDADCLPSTCHWVATMVKEMNDTANIIIGTSPYVITQKSLKDYYIQFEAFMTIFLYSAFTQLKRPYMAVGRNLAIRKSFFITSNGYEPIKQVRGGDDDLFIQRSSKKGSVRLCLNPQSPVNTYPVPTWKAYFLQKLRHFSVSSQYSSESRLLLTSYHLFHLFLMIGLVMSYQSPHFLPIILFYLTFKVVSYRFVSQKIGSGFNYILLPLVDVMYAFFTPILGVWSKLIKDIKWKN